MANLRDLLLQGGNYPTTRTTTLYKSRPGNEFRFIGLCNIVQDNNYCRNYMCWWTAPAGTTKITFELWGGGGSGAGSCCCSWGAPGGAGAYARKTIQGCLGNTCYEFFVAYAGCCSPVQSCGYRGCQTWLRAVSGCAQICNLVGCNFCAEGGIPGCGVCWACGCHGCGYWRPAAHENCCACYYGADYGVAGLPGYLYTDICDANSCYYKQFLPIPAEIYGSQVSYWPSRSQGVNSTGSGETCQGGSVGAIGGGTEAKTPGIGGFTAHSQGGNCYCGGPGGPGMVRITYS